MNSRSKEDYLKNIYFLQSAEGKTNTTALAKQLRISAASVSEMVSRLSFEGLISNTPYHGFNLTTEGEKVALNLIRKHKLIEVFLQQHLDYKWDEVHSEAERLEHAVSDTFINRLEKYLGNPGFDAHGDPIPDMLGNVKDHHDIMLCKASEGEIYIVTKVRNAPDDILQYLDQIGLRLNSKLKLKQRLASDQSLLVSMNDKDHLLSSRISEHIYVKTD